MDNLDDNNNRDASTDDHIIANIVYTYPRKVAECLFADVSYKVTINTAGTEGIVELCFPDEMESGFGMLRCHCIHVTGITRGDDEFEAAKRNMEDDEEE
jgi:hypothetical protein